MLRSRRQQLTVSFAQRIPFPTLLRPGTTPNATPFTTGPRTSQSHQICIVRSTTWLWRLRRSRSHSCQTGHTIRMVGQQSGSTVFRPFFLLYICIWINIDFEKYFGKKNNSIFKPTLPVMANKRVDRGTAPPSNGPLGGTDWTTAPVKSCNARPTVPYFRNA